MTFDELRATISTEMPPGWTTWLRQNAWIMQGSESIPTDWVAETRLPWGTIRITAADSPEALLAAWRELRETLK